jgi:AcrR family transcriptional regulator
MTTTSATTRRRKGLARAEQVAQNHQALLDAARQVFRDHGYAGASLDAVAEAAGFTKGAVYSHFASKADLFLQLLEARIDERFRRQVELTAGMTRDGARAFAQGVYATSSADPQWRLAVLEFRVIAARDPELNARYAAAHRRTVEGIVETLRLLFERLGTTPGLPLEALAVVALVLDSGGFLEDLASPGSVPDDLLSEQFERLAGWTGAESTPEGA